MRYAKYTKEQEQWLIDNVKDVSYKDLANRFNEKFDSNRTANAIQAKCGRLGVLNGRDGCFEKGMTPWNKGLTGYMGPNKTSFKKGDVSPNYRPVGSERTLVTGYQEVKVADPNVWKLKHRLVWEEITGEQLEDRDVIIFLDQDRSNLNLDNLAKVSRAELARLNQGGYLVGDKDLSLAGLNIVRLEEILREGV